MISAPSAAKVRNAHRGGLGGSAPKNHHHPILAKSRSDKQDPANRVELRGIEPLTPALQRQCSTN